MALLAVQEGSIPPRSHSVSRELSVLVSLLPVVLCTYLTLPFKDGLLEQTDC